MSSSFNIRPGDRPGQNMITQGGGQAGAYGGPINFYDDGSGQAQLAARRQQSSDQAVANIGQTGARLQQQRFKTVFPWLQGQVTNLMGQFGQAGQPGAQSPAGPTISAGPVISSPQLQQNINAMRARGDQSTQTLQQQMAQKSAGQGMSATSPLVQAMQNQAQMANLGQQVGGERDLRMGAATTNSQQMLQGQQAREEQFASRQREQIARQQNYLNLFPGLLNSIGGLV